MKVPVLTVGGSASLWQAVCLDRCMPWQGDRRAPEATAKAMKVADEVIFDNAET